jgi:hypothetical protein
LLNSDFGFDLKAGDPEFMDFGWADVAGRFGAAELWERLGGGRIDRAGLGGATAALLGCARAIHELTEITVGVIGV